LVEFGDTRVLCTASVDDLFRHFLRGKGRMGDGGIRNVAARDASRTAREAARSSNGPHTSFTRRFNDSLAARYVPRRSQGLGERTVTIDCDVLQATAARAPRRSPGGYLRAFDAMKSVDQSACVEEQSNPRAGRGNIGRNLRWGAGSDLDYAEDSAPRPT